MITVNLTNKWVVLFIATIVILLIGSQLLPKITPILIPPQSACANIPPRPTITTDSSFRVISPQHGDDMRVPYGLPIVIETENFDLKKEGNSVVVWVDGKQVEGYIPGGGVILSPFNFEEANVSAEDGAHDICLVLFDNNASMEVGDRVGLQVTIRFRGPDQIDWSWANQCFGIVVLAGCIAAVITVVSSAKR